MNETQTLLNQLRGVQAPSVSALPAYGWWILLLVLIILLYCLFRTYRHYKSMQWRREARAELLRLRTKLSEDTVAQTLAATSRLTRRVLLYAQPREEVANLHGDAWLDTLDRVCGKPLFSGGFGRLLESGPYQRSPSVSQTDMQALFDAVDELITAAARFNRRVR